MVTESGAALRELTFAGRPLVDGFAQDDMATGGRGQILMPWPNRIRDGQYSFGGADFQLALTEPRRHNASHGLVRWVAWGVEEHTAHTISLHYRLMAQTGYPWTLDLQVLYDVCADGLTVTQSVTNRSGSPAPYASGAHPYLVVGTGPVDDLELTIPAATRSIFDDRLLPVDRTTVEGSAYDFRMPRPIRTTAFNDAFTDLDRDAQGTATTVLRDPSSGHAVALWVDSAHRWLQVYTADDVPATARRSLAVEPMTGPGDGFRSGDDLVTLAPAGESGDQFSASWGIRALD